MVIRGAKKKKKKPEAELQKNVGSRLLMIWTEVSVQVLDNKAVFRSPIWGAGFGNCCYIAAFVF
jgi:hypothetical protein